MNALKKFWSNKKVKFGVVTAIYILWFVIWTENLWWLLGVPVIYDYYFSRYIDKIFLNKYRAIKAKYRAVKFVLEWVEALLFAVVVVVPLKLYFFGMYVIPTSSMEQTLLVGDYLMVDRLAYGPKMPVTPISFPFVQHTMPFSESTPSFVEWCRGDYKRLRGYSHVKNMDVVVFNFPAGDTVAMQWPSNTFYDLVRTPEDRAYVTANSEVVYRPVDKRENYIKRCVAVAGDTLLFKNQTLYINSVAIQDPEGVEYDYVVQNSVGASTSVETLTADKVARLKYDGAMVIHAKYQIDSVSLFPHAPSLYPFSKDSYGPLWIPKAGSTIELSLDNLPLYERIIKNYEGNELEVRGEDIFVNGKKANFYTFSMDYYFMMGDNRDNSADSRFWGFVPEDHIEGRAAFVWLSIEEGKSIFNGIRWSRIFQGIE